jgi:hypothetical protein
LILLVSICPALRGIDYTVGQIWDKSSFRIEQPSPATGPVPLPPLCLAFAYLWGIGGFVSPLGRGDLRQYMDLAQGVQFR